MALGKNIEHLRNLRGMSRGTVARAIGLDDDQPIYALEKRDSRRSNLAPALAKFFNIPLEELLENDLTSLTTGEIGGTTTATLPSSNVADEGQAALLRVYESLSANGKAELLRYAEYLQQSATKTR